MTWNSSLHPRAAAGSSAGGQFTAGGSGQQKQAKAQPAKGGAKTGAKAPSFALLQKWEKQAQAGKKLSAAQKTALHRAHLAHVAHEQQLAAMKAKANAAKKAAVPTAKAAPKKAMTSGQKTKAMQAIRSGR